MTMPGGNSSDRKWNVIYVRARHEKTVRGNLTKSGIETFLPMRKELHQWSDRKKWVEVPLFSSYVFVNIAMNERNLVYLTDGFIRFVSSNGKPSVVPQWQIDSVRKIVELFPDRLDTVDNDCVGMEGHIVSGPLAGLKGEIVQVMNEKYFVIRIEGLEKALAVKVPVSEFRVAMSNRAADNSEFSAASI